MPTVTVTETEVVVHLNWLERAAALSGDIRVPLADVASATVSSSPWTDAKWKGVPVSYALGTGLPFLLTLGRTVHMAGVDFVCVKRNLDGSSYPALVLALRERAAFRTVVVTVPEAAALAGRIQESAAAAAAAWVAAEAAKLAEAEAEAAAAAEAERLARERDGGGSGAL